MKSADGSGVVRTFTFPAGAAGNLVAAPGAGFRHRITAVTTLGSGGTLRFFETTSGIVRLNMDTGTNTRPYTNAEATNGLAVFGDNEGIDLVGAGQLALTITVVTEPTL